MFSYGSGAGIDDGYALSAGFYCDVGAGSCDQIDAVLYGEDFDFTGFAAFLVGLLGGGGEESHVGAVFGIGGLGASADGYGGGVGAVYELVEECVFAREVVGDFTFRAVHYFDYVFAGPQPVDVLVDVEDEVVGLDEGFGQVDGVGDDADVGEAVAVADEVFGERGHVAFGEAVAAEPAHLDVGRRDGEDVAFPFSGGETHPGVGGVVGRVGTAIHPDGAGLLVGADVHLDGDDLLGVGVLVFPEAEGHGAAVDVGDDVDAALLFLER